MINNRLGRIASFAALLLGGASMANHASANVVVSAIPEKSIVPINTLVGVNVIADTTEEPTKEFRSSEWRITPSAFVNQGELPVAGDFFDGYSMDPDYNYVDFDSGSRLTADVFSGPCNRVGVLGEHEFTFTAPGTYGFSFSFPVMYDTTGKVYRPSAKNMTLQSGTVIATYLGDANLDYQVTLADLQRMVQFYGGSGGWEQGDFSGDGRVNLLDVAALAKNYGMGVDGEGQAYYAMAPGMLDSFNALRRGETLYDPATNSLVNANGIYSVPEPSTGLALLGLGAGAMATLGRMGRKRDGDNSRMKIKPHLEDKLSKAA